PTFSYACRNDHRSRSSCKAWSSSPKASSIGSRSCGEGVRSSITGPFPAASPEIVRRVGQADPQPPATRSQRPACFRTDTDQREGSTGVSEQPQDPAVTPAEAKDRLEQARFEIR